MTETPVAGVTYARSGTLWVAPGRPSLTASAREALVNGTYMPDSTTTGLTSLESSLVTVSGNVTYSTTGETVTGKRFTGKVSITASNVRFKDCLFEGPLPATGEDPTVVCTSSGVVNLIFEDCEFRPRALTSGTNCVTGHHFTLLRCRLHHAVDLVGVIPKAGARADVFILGCYFTDLVFFSPDPFQPSNFTHNDLIQWHGGAGLTIIGNRFESFYEAGAGDEDEPAVVGPAPNYDHLSGNPYYPAQNGTSVLLCNSHVGDPSELVFSKNWADGGAVALNLASAPNMIAVGTITDNKFGRDFRLGPDYAIIAKSFQTFTLTGNTRWDTGEAFNVRKNG